MSVCPPTWLISANMIRTSHRRIEAGTIFSRDNAATANNPRHETTPDHAMIVIVENRRRSPFTLSKYPE